MNDQIEFQACFDKFIVADFCDRKFKHPHSQEMFSRYKVLLKVEMG